MRKIYRQGDVLILAGRKPKEAKPVPRDNGRIVLAYGEVTGHAHAILDREAELFSAGATTDRFLQVLAEGGVALTHEEHDTITLPKGTYRVRIQREYHPEALRNVAD